MSAPVVAILGAGSFGTAIAIHIAKLGFSVKLWAHSAKHVDSMKREQVNVRYLPNVVFPSLLQLSDDLDECIIEATHVIIAVPSHAFVDILAKLTNKPLRGLSWLTKGIDPSTHAFLSDLVIEQWGSDFPLAVISGPSFAREVAQGLPTALVLAGNHPAYLNEISTLLQADTLRVYFSSDMIGVQLAGAVKNVLAIACGVSDGLNFGANAKAALITRGLAEMSRLGAALGAVADTFLGLAGVGDLVLTCTDDQSRNRRFGIQLGRGLDSLEAEQSIGQVVEGKNNAYQICSLAEEHTVDMPICNTVQLLLTKSINPHEAFINLMQRPVRVE